MKPIKPIKKNEKNSNYHNACSAGGGKQYGESKDREP